MPLLRIGDVAKITGVSTSTIRWYESLGLLLPQRESSGYRLYSPADAKWIMELRSFMAATGTGPRALARIMRWLPLPAIRAHFLGAECKIANPKDICWKGNTDSVRSRICRSCPTYEHKRWALEYERHFTASLSR